MMYFAFHIFIFLVDSILAHRFNFSLRKHVGLYMNIFHQDVDVSCFFFLRLEMLLKISIFYWKIL